MRALKNDPLDHFLICKAAKKDPTGSIYIVGFVQSHGKDTGWKRQKLERFKEKAIRQ